MLQHPRFGPCHIGVRNTLEGKRQRLDDQIVQRDFPNRVAVLVLWGGGVHLFAKSKQGVDLRVDRQIIMRDRLLRFDQSLGDDLADVVVRDDFETALFVKLGNLGIRHRRRDSGASAGFRRRQRRFSGLDPFDIRLDHAAMRA